MSTPIEAMAKLDGYAHELDQLSRQLADLDRQLVPVEEQYEKFIADFEIGLYLQSKEQGDRLPSERLRLQLAHREIPPELLGRYVGLTKSRDRMNDRIGSLKKLVEAQRSILSALKVEAELAR